MKVVFATLYDPADVSRGSGTYYFMTREIERQGHAVHYVGPVDYSHPPLISRFLNRTAALLGKKHRLFQDVFVARQIGREVTRQLVDLDYDVLLTNFYSIAGYTQTVKPIVIYTDTVFARRYSEHKHPWWSNLSPVSVAFCQQVTRRGIERASLCCYPSDWAVQEALKYGVPGLESRIERIEFGANLFESPSAQVANTRSFTRIRDKGHFDLLFVGNRDWILKGGDVAVDTVEVLRQWGIPAVLHIVGATPPYEVDTEYVKVHGVIDKAQEVSRLAALYETCDALILPTRAEGFGIVFVEAAAYGLPSLSYDSATGVNNAVRHGETGILLDMNATAIDFARGVEGWFASPADYKRLVSLARTHAEQTLNWETAIGKLSEAIGRRIGLAATIGAGQSETQQTA